MSGATRKNRLAVESSPYLRQHAGNPVDWYPWGPEAFEAARRLDRPVFLSIGYSSCHWCHVMAHESFENEGIAALLNDDFISVKVDREERPDVDELYMTAVQLTTGQGGWPLSAFLFPDKRPFFAATYFPPEDRGGHPGFRTLLSNVESAWRKQRGELERTAAHLAHALAGTASLTERETRRPLSEAALDTLQEALSRRFDGRHGGFGGAPKFPPHSSLAFLLERAGRGDAGARGMATRTLEAMALGGIRDHLGGGFHRYSTDGRWLVPHFEKMLSDNGQLLAAYSRAYELTRRPLFRRTALEIAEYLLREMRGPEGAFFAATDADSEGEEGKFFVFREEEIVETLGAKDAAFFGPIYGVRPEGNWRDEAGGGATGTNILHLAKEPTDEEEARLAPLRAKLLALRGGRVPPGLDDKRIAGWNALALAGLVAAGRALGEERYRGAARVLARFFAGEARDGEGRLLRVLGQGAGAVPAFLEDEAFLANALLDMAEGSEKEPAAQALHEARRSVDALRRRFRRPGAPGFTFSGEGHETLLATARDLFDKATPSGSAEAARALARLARLSGDASLAAEAREAIEEVSGLMARAPHGTETWHLALAELLAFERANVPSQASGAVPGAVDGPIRVECSPVSARLSPGESVEVGMKIVIAPGWHIPHDGLHVEALAGSGLEIEKVSVPAAPRVRIESGEVEARYEESVAARLVVAAGPHAAPGEWLVGVTVRFRACGEGICRPERALSFAVPLRVT